MNFDSKVARLQESSGNHRSFSHLFFLKIFIYLFVRDTERKAETQAEGEAGSTRGARRGTRSWDSRLTPWAKGSAKPLGHPGIPSSNF